MAMTFSVVGKPSPRVDGFERVTGQAKYAGDIQIPGMLYARILRSPYPHARIKGINTAKAEALPGVKAILTSFNTSVQWSSGDRSNKRYVFNNPVRFAGEPVAAVAAGEKYIAEDALGLIDAEYEPLHFILDPRKALEEGAPQIHPGGNLLDSKPYPFERGNVEKGFAEADHIFEDTYVSKQVINAQMEPRVSVAFWEGGKLTVWASTQGITSCRSDLAKDLGLPLNKVRVICKYMGGGFGNKGQAQDLDLIAALLAKKTGKPVKLELTREEDYMGMHGRWPTIQEYKIGVKKDGTITAISLKGFSGLGGYNKGPFFPGSIAGARDLYRCPNVKTEVYPAYTNTTCGANYRAPAYPQGIFGVESIMDHVAYQLKIDPLEFRLKNFTTLWDGILPYTTNALEDCIREGAEKIGWKEKWHRPGEKTLGNKKHGIAMAMGLFPSGVGMGAAIVKVNADGSIHLMAGVTDIGTGAKTTMSILAAEAMGVPLEKVQIISGDTDVTPYSVGESGSRTTCFTGQAVLAACEDAKKHLLELASQILEVKPEALEIRNERIYVKGMMDKGTTIEEVARKFPDAIVGSGFTNIKLENMARQSFAAHFAEVEVDIETGEIKLLNYVAVHDSGKIINPLTAESQVIGGVVMGASMALTEELIHDKATGIPLNPNYRDAKVLTHLDIPKIEPVFVEKMDPFGPYGAKGLGEPPITPVVACIANAIFNATAIRLKELPLTQDKIVIGYSL